MREERLLRSRKDYVIGGVAGGFGEYLKIDAVIIRIIFVITAFLGGGGLIVYILLWIFIPENENQKFENNMEEKKMKDRKTHYRDHHNDEFYNERKKRGNIIGGLSVLTIGILFLIDNFIPGINFGDLWPVILVAVGIGMIFSGLLSTNKKEKEENNKEEAKEDSNK